MYGNSNREMLPTYTYAYIRIHIQDKTAAALHKRILKHLTKQEGMVSHVWELVSELLTQRYAKLQEMVTACYGNNCLSLSLSPFGNMCVYAYGKMHDVT
jgi:hypothetical protein